MNPFEDPRAGNAPPRPQRPQRNSNPFDAPDHDDLSFGGSYYSTPPPQSITATGAAEP